MAQENQPGEMKVANGWKGHLRACASPGYELESWYDAGENPISTEDTSLWLGTVTGDAAYRVEFRARPRLTVTTAVVDMDGNRYDTDEFETHCGGYVTRNDTHYDYATAQAVSLTAHAFISCGWAFHHWEEDCVIGGATNPLTVTIDDDKTVTAVFAPLGADFITVQILSADVTEDRINVTLRPEQRRGVFTLKLIGPEVQHTIRTVQDRASGSYAETFDIPNLAVGEYTQVYASWEVDGELATDTFDYHIYNLGVYRHTQYTLPDESHSTCQGPAVDVCFTDTACNYECGTLCQPFDREVWENGSGTSQNHGTIQREWDCQDRPESPVPESCSGKHLYRANVAAPVPSCGGTLDETIVATMRRHPVLDCGDRVYVVGIGVKTVGDVGGQVNEQQLDHFTNNRACSGIPSLPNAVTIKLFD
jgi:hypothetical protein